MIMTRHWSGAPPAEGEYAQTERALTRARYCIVDRDVGTMRWM